MKLLFTTLVLQAQWSAVPEGRTGADVEFNRIVDLTTASGGRLAFVLDGPAGVVRVIDRSGRQTIAFGRKGEGPGELARAIRLGWVFDTLWVLDAPSRMHYFRQDGRLLRSVSAPQGTYGATATGGYLTQQLTGTVPGPGPRGAVTISHQTGATETPHRHRDGVRGRCPGEDAGEWAGRDDLSAAAVPGRSALPS